MTTADKLRGLMSQTDELPWCVAWHAQRKPIARAESTDPHTDGKEFGLYASTMIPKHTDRDLQLAVASVNLLPALAAVVEAMQEIAKEESGGYGYYLGGDPRKFCPDEESCTPQELAAHKEACEKWNEAEAKGEKMEPDPCGSGWISPSVHVTRSAYGLGSYTLPTDAARMAQAALSALDAAVAREVG